MNRFREAYVTGIGQSEVGIRLQRHPLLLTVDAVREALADAGLAIDQIDGVSTYPGRAAGFLGFSPVGADELVDALGIRASWYAGGGEITSQLGALVAAVAEVRDRHPVLLGGLDDLLVGAADHSAHRGATHADLGDAKATCTRLPREHQDEQIAANSGHDPQVSRAGAAVQAERTFGRFYSGAGSPRTAAWITLGDGIFASRNARAIAIGLP